MEIKVEVSEQENGRLDVWISEGDEVLGHYLNAKPSKVGEYVMKEVERKYGA